MTTLTASHLRNRYPKEGKSPEWDFVIVGAGSAGCALASRLSEDPEVRVLLVEAGPSVRRGETAFHCAVPAAGAKLQHDPNICWEYYAEPSSSSSSSSSSLSFASCTRLKEGKSYWPRGKGVGGSSLINYMAYVRGNRGDYDGWVETHGANGWSYDELLPLMKRMEDASSVRVGDNDNDSDSDRTRFRGFDGPLTVSSPRPPNPIAERFVAAAGEAGHRTGHDYNGREQCGAALHQHTVRHGTRCSVDRAYLDPLRGGKRPNLEILGGAHVARVLLEERTEALGSSESSQSSESQSSESPSASESQSEEEAEATLHAVGVELVDGYRLQATKEVVLCAGAIGTPHILLLSGIGPRNELELHDIACRVDSPGVGKGMQDHVMVPLRYNPARPGQDIGSINEQKVEGPWWWFRLGVLPHLWQLWFRGEGILTSSTYDASLFAVSSSKRQRQRQRQRQRDKANGTPDMQISLFAGPGDESILCNNLRVASIEGFLEKKDLARDAEGAVLVCTLLHPRSTGSITLRSNDPMVPPRIVTGYFTDGEETHDDKAKAKASGNHGDSDSDMKIMLEVIHTAIRLVHQPSLRTILAPDPLLPRDILVKHGVFGIEQDDDEEAYDHDACQHKAVRKIPGGGVLHLSDAVMEELIRGYGTTLYHPVGTAKMGEPQPGQPDPPPYVVDGTLRVRGVATGLRVADASIQPEIVSGNTNASCVLIGEKAADILREHYNLSTNTNHPNRNHKDSLLRGAAAREIATRLRWTFRIGAVGAVFLALEVSRLLRQGLLG